MAIKQIKNIEQTYFVEWFYKCEFEGNMNGFDGVSIIVFIDDKISSVKEFQSKSQHHYPYEEH